MCNLDSTNFPTTFSTCQSASLVGARDARGGLIPPEHPMVEELRSPVGSGAVMLHSWLAVMVLQLFLLAEVGRSVQVRLKDDRLYGIVGRPLQFDAEYTRGSWRDIYSVTWKLKRGVSLRLFQYVMKGDKMYMTPAYRGRVRFQQENGSMVLLNVTMQDNGTYFITVIDTEGSEQKASTQVQVYDAVSRPVIVASQNSHNATLRCLAQQGTELRYHWLKDGQDLVSSNVSVVSGDGHSLSLLSLTSTSCGVYTCFVTNTVSQESVNKTLSGANGFTYCREEDSGTKRKTYTPIIMIVGVLCLLLAACIYQLVRGKVESVARGCGDQRAGPHDTHHRLSDCRELESFLSSPVSPESSGNGTVVPTGSKACSQIT
ncbi:hepatic and glial cell adhesion molecule-like [Mustelus asterias]